MGVLVTVEMGEFDSAIQQALHLRTGFGFHLGRIKPMKKRCPGKIV